MNRSDRELALNKGIEVAARIKDLIPKQSSDGGHLDNQHIGFVTYLLKEARDLYEKEENKS